MEKKLFVVESSSTSVDGTLNPVVHAVMYCTKDSLIVKVLEFIQKHDIFVSNSKSDSLDAKVLVETCVDARLVSVLSILLENLTDDISFDCPEWQTSYRIREVEVAENLWRSQRISTTSKVILGVEFLKSVHGDCFDFETGNFSIRPEHRVYDSERFENPQYAEMQLSLNQFYVEGLEW